MTPTITLFTYGTVRYGQFNFEHIANAYESHEEAVVNGRLYLAVTGSTYYGYPLANFAEQGTVVGDVLRLRADDPGVAAVIEMEMSTGYVPCHVEYTTRRGETGVALAFHYKSWSHRELFHIEDGDWIAADATIRALTK